MSRPDTRTEASGVPKTRRAANPCRMRDSGADDLCYKLSRVTIVNRQSSTITSPNRRRAPATNSALLRPRGKQWMPQVAGFLVEVTQAPPQRLEHAGNRSRENLGIQRNGDEGTGAFVSDTRYNLASGAARSRRLVVPQVNSLECSSIWAARTNHP